MKIIPSRLEMQLPSWYQRVPIGWWWLTLGTVLLVGLNWWLWLVPLPHEEYMIIQYSLYFGIGSTGDFQEFLVFPVWSSFIFLVNIMLSWWWIYQKRAVAILIMVLGLAIQLLISGAFWLLIKVNV